MRTAHLQLERLRRNYDEAISSFDEVAFLDLANTLRIWVEMAKPLAEKAPDFSKAAVFKSATPTKQISHYFSGHRHVLALTPEPLPTGLYRPPGGGLFSVREDPPGDFSVGASIRFDSQGRTQLSNPYFVDRASLDDKNEFNEGMRRSKVTRLNFRQWLEADAVRVAYPDGNGKLQGQTLSRAMLVKRVANILDGSHASMAISEDNKFDPAVRFLLDFRFQDVPLPFFLALKIAENILHWAPKYLKV